MARRLGVRAESDKYGERLFCRHFREGVNVAVESHAFAGEPADGAGRVAERVASQGSSNKGVAMRHMPWMVSCALMAGATAGAGADVVGYWHFNGIDPSASTVFSADQGSGTLDISSFGSGAVLFGGTEMNAMPGVDAGDALGLTGSSHNGSYAQLDFSTLGTTDLSLSFAARRSSTGFADDRVDALISGSWITVATFTASSTNWSMVNVDLSSINALENGFASLRLVFDGATSGSGTVRFDNLVIGGTVPAPGAAALLGLAGLVGSRRRR